MTSSPGSPPERRASLKDVARAAGVSVATASKALNGRFDVSPATREHVIEVAARLDFGPNLIAQGLRSGTSRTVAALTDGGDGGRFTFPVMLGAEKALGDIESSVILCNSHGDREREAFYMRDLLKRQVDGMIIVGDAPHGREPVNRPPHLSVVYAIAYSRDPKDVSYAPDNRQGGMMQADYLLAQGRRKIAIITGPEIWDAATERVDSAVAHLAAGGAELAAPVAYGLWTELWGWERCRRLIDDGVEVDGIICGNDLIARGVVDALHSSGVRVPDDIAVIGFDNWQLILAGSRTPFPSVDMNMFDLGRVAAQAAMGLRDDGPGVHFRPCTLVPDGTEEDVDEETSGLTG